MKPKTLKPKKCKYCKFVFEPKTPLQFVCSQKCAIEYAKSKQRLKVEKEWKTEKKDLKERLKTHSDHLKDLEKVINRLIRIIDKGHSCISCNGTRPDQAGHLHSVGSSPELRFNLENIWNQDAHCNKHKHGNLLKYLDGIKRLYGEEYEDYLLHELPLKYKSLKLSVPEIQDAVKKVKEIIKELEKLDLTYTIKQRRLLRVKYNKIIGIYN